MIPKIIHYCWFGGKPLPKDAKRCIASWKRYLPDYEIREWNESNFDVHCNTYCDQAYEAKKYAFVSDYARFWILYHYGGIYFDTDVEVIRPLDNILKQGAYMGCETSPTPTNQIILVNPGLGMAMEKTSPLCKEILDIFAGTPFIFPDGRMNLKTIVYTTTEVLTNHGLQYSPDIQTIDGITIYPQEYFCPISVDGDMNVTTNTYTIHHYAQSWRPSSHVWLRKLILSIGGSKFKRFAASIYYYFKGKK